MSNKAALLALRALACALPLMVFAGPRGALGGTDLPAAGAMDETVDTFARRQLDEGANATAASGSGLELIFTQTEGRTRSAYLLVDGRYGKDVRRGDVVKGWTIRAIESDSVDISRNGRRETLLLAGAVPAHPTTSASVREPDE